MARPVVNYNIQFNELKDAITFMKESNIVQATNDLKEYTATAIQASIAMDKNRWSTRISRFAGTVASIFITGTVVLLCVLGCAWILKTLMSLLGVH